MFLTVKALHLDFILWQTLKSEGRSLNSFIWYNLIVLEWRCGFVGKWILSDSQIML